MSDEKLFPAEFQESRTMIFVDGENLAMRFGEMFTANTKGMVSQPQRPGIRYEPGVAVWSQFFGSPPWATVVRRNFYTSLQGDEPTWDRIENWRRIEGLKRRAYFGATRTGAQNGSISA